MNASNDLKSNGSHERLSHKDHPTSSSDRSFGIVFTVVFAILGLWPLVSGGAVVWRLVGTAAAILVVALIRPSLLAWPNRIWTRFGLLLHSITSPIILGLLFFVSVTPIGLLMRMTGKDPLRLRLDPAAKSYWIEREPPGPAPESMKQQF